MTDDKEADQLLRAVPIDARVPSGPLYHYTTAEGLHGILAQKSLRATDADFLNDRSEYTAGLDRCIEILKSLVDYRDAPFQELQRRSLFDMSLVDFLGVVRRNQASFREQWIYGVACLCDEGDLLSQWRGYGGSGGYAIGFDGAALRSNLSTEVLPLVPVTYGRVGDSVITSHFDSWLETLEGTGHDVGNAANAVHVLLTGFGIQMKDKSFAAESEWRIADLRTIDRFRDDIKFRPGPLGPTPYLNIGLAPVGELPKISEIVMGPGADFAVRRRSIRILLKSLGYPTTIRIVESAIPFRAW